MNYLKRVILFIAVVFAAPAAGIAGDTPHAPRLTIDGDRVAGGFQVDRHGDGTFELFRAAANGDDLRLLGRFYGHLAGVALDSDGNVLALTRDGALGRYDDNVRRMAEPDSRWNMVGLSWHDNAPVAFANDNGRLHLVRLDGNGSWQQEPLPIATVGDLSRLECVTDRGSLHVLWSARARDLSEGAIRHALYVGGKWQELTPLPLGDVAAFTALCSFGETVVAAIRRNILNPEERRVSSHFWNRDHHWEPLETSDDIASILIQSHAFAAATDARTMESSAWLITSARGAFFTPVGSEPAVTAIRVGAEAGKPDSPAELGSLMTLGAIALMVLLSCRRSRAMSRLFPARPPDLFSRGSALMADWLLVSFAMSAYHLASGDVRILNRLLMLGEVRGIIWSNLLALIAFTALAEGLWGCTPGKYLAGLRVRSLLGGRPAFLQAVLRNLLRAVDMFPLPVAFPGLIGLMAAMFNPRRQRFGDIMASTIVRRHAPLAKRKYLLASASPRRLELLRALGIDVRAEAMHVDEDAVREESPDKTVGLLAQTKARAAAKTVREGEVVIAADTVVTLDGTILGKPADEGDARNMLRLLSGRAHSVFTGVAVWDTMTGQALVDVDETEVEFRELSDREIADYVATGDPMDKAGGYGVQSGFLVKQVRGSLSNVAGLPMEKLQSILHQLDS